MECPGCGRYVRGEDTVCQYCGHRLSKNDKEKKREEKKGKEKKGKEKKRTKKFIPFLLIIVVGGSLFYFVQDETESADKLVQAAKKELETGSKILEKVELELQTLREVQLETVDYISERDYASQSKERIRTMLQYLDTATPAFERAEEFLEKCEELRLPAWYHRYVDVEGDIVQKYKEYTTVLETLSNNYSVYYEFAEHYLTAEQLVVGLMDHVDRGNDHLERGDYTFAFAAYQAALRELKEAQTAYLAASKMIDLPYMDDLLSNMNHLERALYTLSEAAHQMEVGNSEQADFLAVLGEQEVESMVQVNKLQLKMQVAQWLTHAITEYVEELEQLKSEIEALEKEAERARK